LGKKGPRLSRFVSDDFEVILIKIAGYLQIFSKQVVFNFFRFFALMLKVLKNLSSSLAYYYLTQREV